MNRPREIMTPIASTQARPRIVIVGAGFGGLSAVKQLARAPFDVTIVDRHNYHLFQPLLYQVATAGLSPGDIAAPIRGILRRQRNAQVILGKVSGIDTARNEVVAEGRRIPFDHLIVATGAEHAYFGNDWSSYAPGLKTIDDATYLRRRILLAFERAETEPDADEQRRLLNFVVVGGGPTGVEVRLGTVVTDCDCTRVWLGQERIETRTIVWAAGVKASPAAEWLDVGCD